MKELTKAEEQVMQLLWQQEKAFVKDLVAAMPEPKPAYNTVSTIVRILETKGFVAHQAYGKTHEYYPLITKDDYRSFYLKSMVSTYFGGSFQKLVSFFAKDNDLDVQELEELMKHAKQELDNPKGDD
ncbi:BlaI/MecI/CopY family transcriptional regulator [Cesiribacter andamanensis]|uniref:Methicillin resistance regulatory protein mecI n=1 Tax=Cesiribacter andamanensis AMV16 TaxID=1279009 RepID=M7NR80_9BACT|nr:BlaI/MecI/CopY family transcriptional regulator [Cesiribacter andamanensis]EMR04215.1 Methicillin resistance regulatory protein mecI [Cesiribacter andamanensis AMV16]